MEKRFLLAIILSVVVLVIWDFFFVPKRQPAEATPTQGETAIAAEDSSAEAPRAVEVSHPIQAEAPELLKIETRDLRVLFTNEGGRILSWKLKGYRDAEGEPLELVAREAREANLLPLSIYCDGDADLAARINQSLYASEQRQGPEGHEMIFRFSDGEGLRVEKRMTFHDGYLADVHFVIDSPNSTPAWLLWGPGFGNPTPEEEKRRFAYANQFLLRTTKGDVSRIERINHLMATQLLSREDASGYAKSWWFGLNRRLPFTRIGEEALQLEAPYSWAGLGDSYFMAVLAPEGKQEQVLIFRHQLNIAGEERIRAAVGIPLSIGRVKLYVGPKDPQLLRAYDDEHHLGLGEVIDFGFFWWIALPLFWVLQWIQSMIGNYGFSIICLTFLIKLVFTPLTHKSFVSMDKMRRLQPKVERIRKRYRSKDMQSRQAMNKEIMGLYQQEGVNPMGGCLPLLLQLPILWGMWNLLTGNIGLRQAPFVLWIDDLSSPDLVLTIIMGASMLLQQMMAPTSSGANPMQQKMIAYVMPVAFIWFFLSLPSGLVLYWLTNNILTIAQQYWIKQRLGG